MTRETKAIVVALVVVVLACLALRKLLDHDDDSPNETVLPPSAPSRFVGPLAVALAQLDSDQHRCDIPRQRIPTPGIVVDAEDRPVEGAVVRCSNGETMTTAADGTFRFGRAEDSPLSATKDVRFGLPSWNEDLETVTIKLVPDEVVVHVREIDETAIPSAIVGLYDERRRIVARKVAGDDGTVVMRIGVGQSVLATARGHTAREIGLPLGYARPIEITARLYAMGEHVVEGRVVDPLGQPVAGAEVTVHPTANALGDAIPDGFAITDADGRFERWVEESESYTVRAVEPLGEAMTEETYASGSTTGLTMRLAPPTYPPVDVEIVVVDERGRAIANAELIMTFSGPRAPIGERLPRRSDANGRAAFQMHARGDVFVTARVDGYASDQQRIRLVDAELKPLPIQSIAATLRMLPTRFSGIVVDERGNPVPDANVGITPGASATTDSHGRFTTTALHSDRYDIGIYTNGCASVPRLPPSEGHVVVDRPQEDLRVVVHPRSQP